MAGNGGSILVERGDTRPPWWLEIPAKLLYRIRHAIVPLVVSPAVLLAGLVAAVVRVTAGPGWLLLAGGCAVALGVALVVFGLDRGYDRTFAAGALVVSLVWVGMICAHPFDPALYGAWLVPSTIGAIGWWLGPTFRARSVFEKDRRRFASTRLGAGARLVRVTRNAGAVVMRVRLGARQSMRDADREQLAHDLDEPVGRVIVERDPQSGRAITVKILARDAFTGPEIPHPALAAGATDEGGPWAPGARSILDPIPVGETRDGEVHYLHLYEGGDAKHGAVFGKTGSGKSGTLSVLVAGVRACDDAVLWASDVPKGGSTFVPWAPAVDWLTLHADRTREQLERLLDVIAWRGGAVAHSDADKWRPCPGSPAIVAVIEEAAALFSRHPELADLAVDVILAGRQAGVILVVASQGADWDSIPTKMRDQLEWVIAHKMSAGAFRLCWPAGAAVADMSLFAVPGLAYVQDGGGLNTSDGIEPVRAYALYGPADKRRLAALYGPGEVDASTVRAAGAEYASRPAELPETTPKSPNEAAPAQRRPDRAAARSEIDEAIAAADAQSAREVELAPGSIRDVFASVPPEPETLSPDDERVRRAILAELARTEVDGEPVDTPRAMSRADLARATGASDATVLRRLGGLRDEGRVEMVGLGSVARWRLTSVEARS